MLTDAQLRDIGDRSVRKSLGEAYHAELIMLTDPNGAWVSPVHKDGPTSTAAGKGPFFVARGDGLIIIPASKDWTAAYTLLQRWRDMGVPGAAALYDGVGTPEPAFVAQWLREWLPDVVRRTSGAVDEIETTSEWEVPPKP